MKKIALFLVLQLFGFSCFGQKDITDIERFFLEKDGIPTEILNVELIDTCKIDFNMSLDLKSIGDSLIVNVYLKIENKESYDLIFAKPYFPIGYNSYQTQLFVGNTPVVIFYKKEGVLVTVDLDLDKSIEDNSCVLLKPNDPINFNFSFPVNLSEFKGYKGIREFYFKLDYGKYTFYSKTPAKAFNGVLISNKCELEF